MTQPTLKFATPPFREAAEAEQHARPSRTRAVRRLFVATVVMLAAIAGTAAAYSHWQRAAPFEGTDNAYVKGDISFVAPRVVGHLEAILVKNNQPVRRGEVLARIDPRDLDAAVMDAEAEVAEKQAALREAAARIALQDAQIARTSASLEAARANAEWSRSEYARVSKLVGSGFITRQRYEEATAKRIQAQSGVAETQAQLRQDRQQIGLIESARQTALAVLRGAEARLYKARLDREAAEIRAPIDGVVAGRQADAGEYVTAGTRLLAIVPRHGLYIEANLRETQLARVRPGDRVEVSVDAVPDRLFCGTVESLSGASGAEFAVLPPDNASGNFTKIVRRFPVRIRLDADQTGLELLRGGMSVVPRIQIGSHSGRAPATGPLAWMSSLGERAFSCGRGDGR